MKRLIAATNVFSEEPGNANAQLIETAGVQIYPGAVFVNGNQDAGFRFATDKSPEDVRAWYRKLLSAWPLYEDLEDGYSMMASRVLGWRH